MPLWGMCLHEGPSVRSRSLQTTWPNKKDAGATGPPSSLAKLSTQHLVSQPNSAVSFRGPMGGQRPGAPHSVVPGRQGSPPTGAFGNGRGHLDCHCVGAFLLAFVGQSRDGEACSVQDGATRQRCISSRMPVGGHAQGPLRRVFQNKAAVHPE